MSDSHSLSLYLCLSSLQPFLQTTMSIPIFILWLVSIPIIAFGSPTQPRGIFLNCGSSEETKQGNITYISDESFTTVGNSSTLEKSDLHPLLSTLRYFPDKSAKKYCYIFSVIKGERFLVRTTYYYGRFDGGKVPPVFDQIIDGTRWFTIDTATDYEKGMSSYYEAVMAAEGRSLSVCLARNENTTSDPFVSAVEVVSLDSSVYNSTDFSKYGLVTVARSSFGQDKDTISFPDDQFNRYWHPFKDENPVAECHSQITPSHFYNLPPSLALSKAITTSRGKDLKIKWPSFPLPRSTYQISLYFQDNRSPSAYSWRVFTVAINEKTFYEHLNVTANGVAVYSKEWPLYGETEIVLTHDANATVGPVINGGEIFQVFPIGGRTLTRDVIAMEELARGFKNPPSDWHGDPCLPINNEWTGVKCYVNRDHTRVISVNLTRVGLIGELTTSINSLTALNHIALGENKLSGSIPDMSGLKGLETLHLEDNQFSGSIPESLIRLPRLREVYLENNKLTGDISDTLAKRNSPSAKVTS